jgi:hypothetical protein
MTPLKEKKFAIITHRSYTEEEPCATNGLSVKAIEVIDAEIAGLPRFIIVETEWAMAHPNYYWVHCYSSEEDMRAAFKAGLTRQLAHMEVPMLETPAPTLEQAAFEVFGPPRPRYYESHQGYQRSFATNDDKASPWFLAQIGDSIEGDLVA